jgi:glucosamine--fructose-6-phosphate aminotransferase (isomerizing)
MCGIVGIVGNKEVSSRIINSLYRLEYRGYDSAGIATIDKGNLGIRKVVGKINLLDKKVAEEPLFGSIGIGHTRWATHGVPNSQNAHPVRVGEVVLVHNGIIENHKELRDRLEQQGIKFEGETDSEVIAGLIHYNISKKIKPLDAVLKTLKELEGAFAIGVLFEGNDNYMIGAKRGAPLAIGHSKNERFLGSDALALSPFTNEIIYLDDDEIAILESDKHQIVDIKGSKIDRQPKKIMSDASIVGKGDFAHFMLKEIYEQPMVVGNAFNVYYDAMTKQFNFKDLDIDWKKISRIYIVACGTSFHAGLVSKYWFENFANIPVEVEIASEFRYRNVPLEKNAAALFISQSGETADTLAALKFCKERKINTVAIVNVTESSIANMADHVLPILAGYEIGVASTKAFSAQALVLGMLSLKAAKDRELVSPEDYEREIYALHQLPEKIEMVLDSGSDIKALAYSIADAQSMLYIGRGTSYPIALEGALKLKELSYIHAEGIASGELKHGSIALVDEKMPVVVIAPTDQLFGKIASNVYEVYSRSGNVVVFTDENGAEELAKLTDIVILPKCEAISTPILYAIATQKLAYHVANCLKKDVDQPRNLAKSVTVE